MTTRGAGFCGVGEAVIESSGISEDFGRLDAAGGQLGDERAVGGEEIVIGEFAGEDPGELLENVRGDIGLGVLGGEEMDFEFLGGVGVLVADAGDFDGLGEGDTELFAEFTGERLFERFGGAHFATGKFPFQGRGVAAAALADEDTAVGTFDDGGDDVEHGEDDFRSKEAMKQRGGRVK